ncbi:Zinc metalloproteinase nas-13 [Diplonema papillatum]|nr:Zinc metalloproteinase nas-13 [Diplonema papillatum]
MTRSGWKTVGSPGRKPPHVSEGRKAEAAQPTASKPTSKAVTTAQQRQGPGEAASRRAATAAPQKAGGRAPPPQEDRRGDRPLCREFNSPGGCSRQPCRFRHVPTPACIEALTALGCRRAGCRHRHVAACDIEGCDDAACEAAHPQDPRLMGRLPRRWEPVDGNVVHEICLSLGLKHEQNRVDRDEYVIVNENNIAPLDLYPFTRIRNSHALGEYDYGSIMHYGSYAFSSNGQKTIEAPQPIGQTSGLSAGDIATIDFLYNGCSAVFAAPVCMTNRNELKTYEINLYEPFYCQFNVEWTADQIVSVDYSLTTAPESSIVFDPRTGLRSGSIVALMFTPTSLSDADKVYTVAATFTARTDAAPSTTCSTTVRVRGVFLSPSLSDS